MAFPTYMKDNVSVKTSFDAMQAIIFLHGARAQGHQDMDSARDLIAAYQKLKLNLQQQLQQHPTFSTRNGFNKRVIAYGRLPRSAHGAEEALGALMPLVKKMAFVASVMNILEISSQEHMPRLTSETVHLLFPQGRHDAISLMQQATPYSPSRRSMHMQARAQKFLTAQQS